MSIKQDRQFARTPAELERKYNLGQMRTTGHSTAKQTDQLTQMSQSMSQYMATTNAVIADLERQNAELAAKVEELSKRDDSAIVIDAGGSNIPLADASGRELKGLVLYGKTTADMVNVGNGGSIIVSIGVSETDENAQIFAVFTPDGLPGVPVSGSGDYTDANGQQWAADHKDFGRGVFVQRIGVIASYAGEEIPGAYLSSTGSLTTGAKVLYVLSEAVETALPGGEMSAFAKLHTNNPGTVISNGAGAWMKVRYVADTKAYIDNKFAEGM
jgi:hypothetical protein